MQYVYRVHKKIFHFKKAKKIQLLLITSDSSAEEYKIGHKMSGFYILCYLLFLMAGLCTHRRWMLLAFFSVSHPWIQYIFKLKIVQLWQAVQMFNFKTTDQSDGSGGRIDIFSVLRVYISKILRELMCIYAPLLLNTTALHLAVFKQEMCESPSKCLPLNSEAVIVIFS